MRAINLTRVLNEANIGTRIAQDPKTTKMVAIAIRHDSTFPRTVIADLGPRPTDAEIVKVWGNLVDKQLADSDFGDLSKDGKLDQWVIRAYINGGSEFEDLAGEGIDALGAWKVLSIRNWLKPQDQDLNKFTTIKSLQYALNKSEYRDNIRRIKNAEQLEKAKRDKKEIVLVDNQRFHVALPINYGACYTFNNQTGHMSNFCTGGSDGVRWFKNYAPDGPIIMVTDKLNINDKNGKWQLHAATKQIVNSTQDQRYSRETGDTQFAILFPGLLKEICRSMLAQESLITNASKELDPPEGYNVKEAVQDIIAKFPNSYKSTPATAKALAKKLGMQPGSNNRRNNDDEGMNQDVEGEMPIQPAQPTSPQATDWRLYVAGRRMPNMIMGRTIQQAQQELRDYARKNRIPTGRAYLKQEDDTDNEQIVRV